MIKLAFVFWFTPWVTLFAMLPPAFAQQQPNDPQAVLSESERLYEEGAFVAALDVLEPVFAEHDVNFHWSGGFASTGEFLAEVYERANQVDRGVRFLHRVYVAKFKGKERRARKGYRHLDKCLLDLALLGKRVDIALEVADDRKRREDYRGWDIDYARIHAVADDTKAALAMIASYLEYELHDSRTQILARREFLPLHGDPELQRLVTETAELVEERRRKLRGQDQPQPEVQGEKPRLAFADVQGALDPCKKVTNEESMRAHSAELNACWTKVLPHVDRYGSELFELLRAEKQSPFYRMMLAHLLSHSTDDRVIAKVAAEVKSDRFVGYPTQLFWFAYTMALRSPQGARPFLEQMLEGADATVTLAAHVMTLGWSELLVQAFGCVEQHCLEDLLRAVAGPNPASSRNAVSVLLVFQEPRLAAVLREQFTQVKQPERRLELLAWLGNLGLPETVKELEAMRTAGLGDEEARKVGEILDAMKPPPEPTFDGAAGIAIVEPAMRRIFFANLILTNGEDVSFVKKTLHLTAKVEDIARLRDVRSAIFARLSDEAICDWNTVSTLILRLRWQQGR